MHRILFLVAPEFELLDLSGPLCTFNLARRMHAAPYETGVVAMTGGGQVASAAGVVVKTEGPTPGGAETVIVVGGPTAHLPHHRPERTARLVERLSGAHRIASVCTGAFYLAEASVLNGRRATTHWRYAPLLQSRFPAVAVEMNRIFVRDRDVWTSAGVSAGIDLALAMIETDCGTEVSKAVAREMVVYHRRPGGQSQFSALLEIESGGGRVREALAFARAHLQEPLTVERLAEAAHVSARQFARIFLKETGETPARAVERLRADSARPRVEDGGESLAAISRETGFGDVERMRRTFVKLYGQAPQTMRRMARVRGLGRE